MNTVEVITKINVMSKAEKDAIDEEDLAQMHRGGLRRKAKAQCVAVAQRELRDAALEWKGTHQMRRLVAAADRLLRETTGVGVI